jgi:hypothetical protein
VIQGTFGVIQGTFGVIQRTFGVIQGTFSVIQGTFGASPRVTSISARFSCGNGQQKVHGPISA